MLSGVQETLSVMGRNQGFKMQEEGVGFQAF